MLPEKKLLKEVACLERAQKGLPGGQKRGAYGFRERPACQTHASRTNNNANKVINTSSCSMK